MKNFFDQPVKNVNRTYYNIRKITKTWLCHWLFARSSLFGRSLDADSKAIQQIHSNGNLDQSGNTTMYIIVDKSRETILDFSQETAVDYDK